MKVKKWSYIEITAIFFIFMCFSGGFLLIYRSQQPIEQLPKYTRTLLNKQISKHRSKSSLRYYLGLTFMDDTKLYGIILGTKAQAAKSDLIKKLDIGHKYVVYIDKTVGQLFVPYSLGIHTLTKDGKVIYRRNSQKDFTGGMYLCILALAMLLTLIYAKRKKLEGLT